MGLEAQRVSSRRDRLRCMCRNWEIRERDFRNGRPRAAPTSSLGLNVRTGGLHSPAGLRIRGLRSRLGVSREPRREACAQDAVEQRRVGDPPGPGGAWAARDRARSARRPRGAAVPLGRAGGCGHLRAGPGRGAKVCGGGLPRLTGDGKRGPGHRAGDAAAHRAAQRRQQEQREGRGRRRPGTRAGPRGRRRHLRLRLAAERGAPCRLHQERRRRRPPPHCLLPSRVRPAAAGPNATRLRPLKKGPMFGPISSSSQSGMSGGGAKKPRSPTQVEKQLDPGVGGSPTSELVWRCPSQVCSGLSKNSNFHICANRESMWVNGYTHQVSQNYYFCRHLVKALCQPQCKTHKKRQQKNTIIQKIIVLALRELTV